MKRITKRLVRVELVQIKQNYASGRLHSERDIAKMASSLHRNGLRVPVVAIEGTEGYILLNGYLRLAAAARCGWDEIDLEVWDCDLATGLTQLLARSRVSIWP